MRHMVYGILAGLLLIAPAAAQSGSSESTPASKTAQDQAKKPDKTAPEKSSLPAGDPAAPAAAPQEVKEDPLANFNILGNAVGDGLGVPR